MTTLTGRIVEVSTVPLGDVLVADATVGDTVLFLNSVVDFNEEGGALSFLDPADDETVITATYTGLDVDAETITLTSALVVDLPLDAFVSVLPTSDEKVAQVMVDGEDESISVRVPHQLFDLIAEGVRDPGEEEAVEVGDDDGGDWQVLDVLGKVPLLDGSHLDPETIPTSDGVPPASSPNVSLIGTVGALLASWSAVTNADPVTYDLHVGSSPGVPTDGSQLFGSTDSTFATLVLTPGTWYVVAVARDADGEAPPGAEASATVIAPVTTVDLTALQDQLDDLDAALATTQGDVATITTTTLPALVSDIAAAQADADAVTATVATLTTSTLPGLLTSIAANASAITTAQGNIATNAAAIATAQGNITTLTTNLTTAQGQIATLNSTTIPGLNTSIAANASAITTAQGQITTLTGTTIPGLNTSIAANTAALATAAGNVTALQALFPITTTSIANDAITTPKILAGAVVAGSIAAGAITTVKLAAGAVTATEIAALAITTAKLDAGAVTAAKITAGTITATQIAAGTLTANEIAAGTILAGNIAAGAITTAKIAAGAITTTELGALSVTAAKIVAGTITATQIAAGTLTANEIAAGAITTVKLAAGAVTATELAAGSVTAAKIVAGTITATELASGSVTTAKIVAGAITTTELGAGSVTAAKIVAGTITATELSAGSITTVKLAAGAVTTTELAAGAVTAVKITAGTITATQIAAGTLTANEIAAGAITTVKLAAGAVTATEIAAGAITATKLSATAIDGKTITGATVTGGVVQTDTTGQRLVMTSAAKNFLYGYSGNAQESSPGSLSVDAATAGTIDNVYAQLLSPAMTQAGYGTRRASLALTVIRDSTGPTYSTKATFKGNQFQFTSDDVGITTSLASFENVSVGTMVAGSIGTSSFRDSVRAEADARVFAVSESNESALTTDASPNSTTNITLAGLSKTITSPGTSAVYYIDILADVAITTIATTNVVELLVDGTVQTKIMATGRPATMSTHRGMQAQRWRITGLSAGSHTFTARTRNTGASSGATIAAGNTAMFVRRDS